MLKKVLRLSVVLASLYCSNASAALSDTSVTDSSTSSSSTSSSKSSSTGVGLDLSIGHMFKFGSDSASDGFFAMPKAVVGVSSSDVDYSIGADANFGYTMSGFSPYLSVGYKHSHYDTKINNKTYSGSDFAPVYGLGVMYLAKNSLYYSVGFNTSEVSDKNVKVKSNNVLFGVGYNI